MEKALQIAYRTLTQYATNQAQYADIRLCHIQSAKDLYGDNSPELQAVAKAWDIVGVTDGTQTGIADIEHGTWNIPMMPFMTSKAVAWHLQCSMVNVQC